MKRKLKLLAIVSLLCICGTFMSSCEYIDDLRSKHAVFVPDIEEIKIQKDGKTYVELEGMYDVYRLQKSSVLRVTDEDVPVLLSERFGRYATYYNDLDIIKFGDMYLCPEEKYDYYMNRCKSEVLDTIAYETYDIYHSQKKVYQSFTESEIELIFSIWNDESQKSVIFEGDDWNRYQRKIWIRACNSDQTIFLKDGMYLSYSLEKDRFGLVIRQEKDGEIGNYSTYTLYSVPDEKREEFRGIINKYYEIMSQSLIAP